MKRAAMQAGGIRACDLFVWSSEWSTGCRDLNNSKPTNAESPILQHSQTQDTEACGAVRSNPCLLRRSIVYSHNEEVGGDLLARSTSRRRGLGCRDLPDTAGP